MSFLKHWLLVCLHLIEVPISLFDNMFKRKKTIKRQPDVRDMWVAIHESGHTIAAYYAKLCVGIESVSIDEKNSGGLTTYHIMRTNDAAYHWTSLVIKLSGIAAEIKKYGFIRSGNSSSDLESSLESASALLNLGENKWPPPWPALHREKYLPFHKMFYRISDEQNQILRSAYAMARHILEVREKQFNDLFEYLATNRVINGKQVSSVLGNISAVKISNIIFDSLRSDIKHNLFY